MPGGGFSVDRLLPCLRTPSEQQKQRVFFTTSYSEETMLQMQVNVSTALPDSQTPTTTMELSFPDSGAVKHSGLLWTVYSPSQGTDQVVQLRMLETLSWTSSCLQLEKYSGNTAVSTVSVQRLIEVIERIVKKMRPCCNWLHSNYYRFTTGIDRSEMVFSSVVFVMKCLLSH